MENLKDTKIILGYEGGSKSFGNVKNTLANAEYTELAQSISSLMAKTVTSAKLEEISIVE